MNAPDAVKKLDELDRRIDVKIREFKDRGEFSDVHDVFLAGVRKRHAAIRDRIDKALRDGMSWSLLEAEFQRDFNGLFEELMQWEDRLDAEAMKTNKP